MIYIYKNNNTNDTLGGRRGGWPYIYIYIPIYTHIYIYIPIYHHIYPPLGDGKLSTLIKLATAWPHLARAEKRWVSLPALPVPAAHWPGDSMNDLSASLSLMYGEYMVIKLLYGYYMVNVLLIYGYLIWLILTVNIYGYLIWLILTVNIWLLYG